MPRTKPESTLKPKASSEGAFFFADGDRITFVDGEECEVCRGDQPIGRYRYRWDDQLSKAVQRTQMALVPGLEEKVAGPDETSMGKPSEVPKAPKAKKPPEQPQTGERWITIHPSKDDPTHYVRVKIKLHPDGTGSVIGGAGGKLNQLRLTKLRSPEEWKENAAKRKAAREEKERKRQKAQTEEERTGEQDALQEARTYHRGERHSNALATLEVLQEVGIEHGLTDDHLQALQAPADTTDPESAKQVEALAREAVKKAESVQKAYEQRLVTDHEARAAALMDDTLVGLGNPLQENVDHSAYAGGETVSNMVALPNGQWLVQSDQAADRTFDDWQDAAKAHVANVAQHDATVGDRSQPDDFYNPKLWVRGDDVVPFDPTIAGKVAALALQRKDIDRSSKAAEATIKKKMPWSAKKGFDLGGITEVSEQEAIATLEQDAKTIEDAIVHGKLLDMAGLLDASAMARDLKIGGMAQLGEVASDVLKVDVLDPAIIDAVGHDEAAKLIAYQIKSAVTDREYEAIMAQHQAHHAEWSTRYAQQMIDEGQPLMDKLGQIHQRMLEIEAGKAEDYTPDELMELDSLAYQSERLQKSLQSSIGTALGQLQASAALSLALESGPRSLRFAVTSPTGELADVPGLLSPLGGDQPSIWSAYGVDADDFSIEDGPDGQLVTLKASGMDKIAKATYDPEDRDAYEQAIAIKRGDYDEADFVPEGFAYRPEHTFTDVRAEAQQFDTSFDYSPDMSDEALEGSIRQYLGARVANGVDPLTVRKDMMSAEFKVNLGLQDSDLYRVDNAIQQLDIKLFGKENFPGQGQVRKAYETLGNTEAKRQRKARKTNDLKALNRQNLNKESAAEAAYRTLAAMPMARAAMKPLNELSSDERKYLRDYAITEIMGEEVEAPAKEETKAGPEVQYQSLFSGFGDMSQPEGEDKIERAPTQWEKFSRIIGGDEKAYEAVRDRVKGTFYNRFASAYSSIQGKPLMMGQQKLQHIERVAAAMLPSDDREAFLAHLRSIAQSEMAEGRKRTAGGQFAVEVDDWMERYEELKGKDRQMSLLTADTMEQGASLNWQRTTLGTQAEADIDAAVAAVAGGFNQVSNAVGIYSDVKWNGGFVAHQRGLKFLEAKKHVGIHFSAGSGKSALMIGAFSHLHGQGKVKRSIVAVPSGVLGQIVGECATFLKPGQYNYSANMNWSREERLKVLTDGDSHLHFTTRESLAGDILHLVQEHTGITADDFQDVNARSEDDRRALVKQALDAVGIDASSLLFSVDEAHDLSRRQGVSPSRRSLVLDALAHHSGYFIHATGTPLKNDASEIADFLQKVGAPEVKDISKFMARYGKNTAASQRSLQRLMAKYAYAVSVKPTTKDGVPLEVRHQKPRVELTTHQKERRTEVQKHFDAIQQWKQQEVPKIMAAKRQRGEPVRLIAKDLDHAWQDEGVRKAVEGLANDGYGKLNEEQKQARIGGQVMGSAMLKYSALNRLYHDTPFEQNGKAQHLVKLADDFKRQGKPMVVFAASAQAAQMLRDELSRRGHRVGYIDGTMDASQKAQERLRFSPAANSGTEAQTDILVTTDAAQTGLNLQRGKALVHYDIPMTQKAWDQRTARIYRRGQTEDVDVHTLVADSPEDEIALARMERKGNDSELFQGFSESLGHSEVLDDTGLAYQIGQMRSQSDNEDQPNMMAA